MRPTNATSAIRQFATWIVVPGAISFIAGHELGSAGGLSHVLKIVLILAMIFAAVRAIARPSIAVFVLIVAAAFEQSVTIAGISTGSTEIALLLFAPALWIGRFRGRSDRVISLSVGAIMVGLVVAALFARDTPAAAWGVSRSLLVLLFGIGLRGTLSRGGNGALRALGLTWVVTAAVVGALGWLQVHGQPTIVGEPYAAGLVDSSWGYYTNFANYEAVSLLIGFGLFIRGVVGRDRQLALISAVCIPVLVTSVLISFSRGAVLLVTVGLFVLLLPRIRRPAALIGALAVLSAVAGIAVLAAPEIVDRFATKFRTSGGSDELRSQLQGAGAQLLRKHAAGIGYDNFRGYVQAGTVTANKALAHAHSLYIQTGLDGGWLMLAGLSVLCVAVVLRGLRMSLSGEDVPFRGAFTAALVGFLVQGWIDFFFFEIGSLVVFVALVVCALAPTDAMDAPRSSPGGHARISRQPALLDVSIQ